MSLWTRIMEAGRALAAVFAEAGQKTELEIQRETLCRMTAGFDLYPGIIERMEKQGWTFHYGDKPAELLLQPEISVLSAFSGDFSATANSLPANTYTRFTAQNGDDHREGSSVWFRDLCDAMGYPREAIPDSDIRAEFRSDRPHQMVLEA